VANNFFQSSNNGIRILNSDYLEIYFNSVNIENNPLTVNTNSYSFSQDNNSSNIFIYNNVLVNNRGGYAYIGNTSADNYSDYNNLYSTGTNLAQWDGTDYSSFSSFQSNSGTNANSYNEILTFNSISDLHIQKITVPLNGVDLSSVVAEDIDGDIRNIPPKIGADEYNVYVGNKTLTTQAEVNNFGANNYILITGNLHIENSTDISDLTPLSTITSVEGQLFINDNDALSNLDGLSNITSIGFGLYVGNNSALTNLAGLSSVTSVGGGLGITYNDGLTNLDGLSNITSVEGNLNIYDNDGLTNLVGLNNITSVGNNLTIFYNDALPNLNGLNSIISVAGDLNIANNSQLDSFCGLDALITPGVSGDGLTGSYSVSGNSYNPTLAELEAGNCEAASLSLNIKVFLEGPYNSNNMNTSLNSSLPLEQPYSSPIHDGTESVSSGFFSSHTDIVDWVIVQLRSDETTIVESRAGFLLNTGDIVDLDGTSPLSFSTNISSTLYFVVYQRNHLPIMTANAYQFN